MTRHRVFRYVCISLAPVSATTAPDQMAVFSLEEVTVHQATIYSDPNACGDKAVGQFGNTACDFVESENVPKADHVHVH